ncbi:fibronectin type III domain-containing protein [Flagellimonas marinaquae]|uniref:fibronectin type III domain-containing protein n=1 Tax=Flagellimonas marinaquae TaxID=254955 RepID=UPI00207536C2|nr:fibronectin type III domain-containing protein [Allomuricauda aquimarina]USD24809.1 fibronectin type III domain-containing protein [Allomuricauda aquimarina]
MKSKAVFIFFLFFLVNVSGQEQFVQSNAAAALNESNSLGSIADIRGIGCSTAVETEIVAVGTYSYRGTSIDGANDRVQISPGLANGVDYEMKVYLAEGPGANIQVEVWAGVTNSTPVISPPISSANETLQEFTISFTTNSDSQTLRFYNRGLAGTDIYLDNVSIVPVNQDTEAPTAPSNLSSNNITETSADLSWDASTDNVAVTDYEVFQDGVSIGFTGGTTNLGVIGLAPDTAYDFTVFAVDAVGNTSTVSNTTNVLTLADTQGPNAVTDLTASLITETTAFLSWSDPGDNVGVTDYEVFQDNVSIGTTGGVIEFNVSGLVGATNYNFTVIASDAAGNTSTVSNIEPVLTSPPPDTEAPSTIADLASSNTTTTTTDLAWSAATDNVGVTNYEVFQDGVSIANTGTTTAFNVTGLSPGTSYDFTVFAEDTAGNVSGASNTETVNTTGIVDVEAPSVISDLSASNTTSISTELSWSASTDNVAVTNYEVFQDGVSIANTGTTTALNVTGLSPSTSYDFTVFAEDAAGNVSGVSNTENVVTSEDSGIVDYTSLNANLATIDWQARDLFVDGNLGVGATDTQGYRLAVAGSVIAESVKVELEVNWPDFVFTKQYSLPSLEEVEDHILANGHLLNIPSADEVEKEGINLGKMNAKLLQKIEELTLYTIQQEKKIQELELQNKKIEKDFTDRLLELEKEVRENR